MAPTPQSPDVLNIRRANPSDLETIAQIDADAFGANSYPVSAFVQFLQISGSSFLVGERDAQIVGYALAAPAEARVGDWWLLSMAVSPAQQRGGIGKQLLQAVLEHISQRGGTLVKLSVAPTNAAALHLYDTHDFQRVAVEPNYFGPGVERIIMSRSLETKEGSGAGVLRPELLLGEAGTSVSFSSVLFAISAGTLALVAKRDDVQHFFAPIVLLTTCMFSAFLAGLFYANASGGLSRIHSPAETVRPLRYGNAVSEYLGVFPLIAAFPLLVFQVTDEKSITIAATVIDLAGFAFYLFSGFDLLSRMVTGRLAHVVVSCALVACVAVMLIATAYSRIILLNLTLTTYIVGCIALAAASIIKAERAANMAGSEH